MSQTSDRYAKALFELAKDTGTIDAVQGAIADIGRLITLSEDFRLFLANPLLSYEERCTVLKAALEGRVPELVYRFLIFITYKGRLSILNAIVGSFDNLYLGSTHQMRVLVKTAMPLGDADKAAIAARLETKFQQKMLTEWVIDGSIIGGFRIFADGKIYDYSFRNQLDHYLQQTT